MAVKDVSKMYELILSVPDFQKGFKLTFQVSKTHLLLMCLLVENGLSPSKERTEELGSLLTKERAAELGALIPEMLKSAGPDMLAFYEKLKQF